MLLRAVGLSWAGTARFELERDTGVDELASRPVGEGVEDVGFRDDVASAEVDVQVHDGLSVV